MRQAKIRPPKGVARQGQRGKIDEGVAEMVLRLVSKGLTETEACAKLDLDRECWYAAKSRHSVQFSGILSRLRAERIDRLIETIETHADTDKARDAGLRADWRAADRLLSIADPRFSRAVQEAVAPPSVTITIAPHLAKLCYPDQPVIDVAPAPLLPDKADAGQAG